MTHDIDIEYSMGEKEVTENTTGRIKEVKKWKYL